MGGGNSKRKQRGAPQPQQDPAEQSGPGLDAVSAVTTPVATEAAPAASTRSATRDLESLAQRNSARNPAHARNEQQRPTSQGSSGPSAVGQADERPQTREGPAAPAPGRASVTPEAPNVKATAKRAATSSRPGDDAEQAKREGEGDEENTLRRSGTRDLKSQRKRRGEGSGKTVSGRSATRDMDARVNRAAGSRSTDDEHERQRLTPQGAQTAGIVEMPRSGSLSGAAVRGLADVDGTVAPTERLSMRELPSRSSGHNSTSPQPESESPSSSGPSESEQSSENDLEHNQDVRELREQVCLSHCENPKVESKALNRLRWAAQRYC